MKIKKMIAALSAVTMLGSLAVAVPASAVLIEQDVFVSDANTEWTIWENDNNNGTAYIDNVEFTGLKAKQKGSVIRIVKNNVDGANIGNPVQVRPTETISFEAGTTYHFSVDYSYTTTSVNGSNNALYVRMPKADSTSRYDDIVIKKTNDSDIAIGNGTKTWDYKPTVNITGWTMQFYLRHVLGEVTYSNFKITKDSDITPSSVVINSNYDGKVLYNGDSIDLTADVKDASNNIISNDVTWTVQRTTSDSDTTLKDADSSKYEIKDGKFTLKNTARDTPGKDKFLYIIATADGVSSTPLKVAVDRCKTVTYTINKGEGVTDTDVSLVSCVITVNGETTGQITNSNNGPGGYMNATMVFTVPEGYTLTIPETSNLYTAVSTNGNTVTVTRDGSTANETVVGNDFSVTGTLTKNTVASTYSIEQIYSSAEDTTEGLAGEASAFSLDVTAGTNAVSGVDVTINETTKGSTTTITSGSNVTFGILVNKVIDTNAITVTLK